MPNAIKYSVSTQTLALKKGNYWIGTGDVSKSPTSTTDYWNGITPPTGGYTIYLNKESNGPSIYVPTNDAELISLTNRIAGAAYTTASQCLVYFTGQTDKMVFNVDYESIVTDGLILNLDAGFVSSYPATGSTWYDLSGNNNNGTLVNGPTFNSSNGGSIVFDGTDDYVNLTSTIQFNTNDFSICGWFRSDSGNTSYKQIWNSGYNGGNPDVEIGLESPTNYLYFYIRPPAVVEEVVKTSYSVNDNLWRYFTATKTSSTISLYVNGALVSSKSGTYTSDVDSAGVIPRIGNGLSNINNRPFKGNIAYVSTYNRALTASEISQNYNAQKGRYVYLLLDLYPSAAAAYSVRKLRSAYTGSAIRVRRSSDNTEQDIGFSDGNLDTSALTTFVGANNGFVTTWYDQSGNARNMTQSTAADQPQIVVSGTVLTQGTKPIMKFTSKTQRFNTTSFALSVNRTFIITVYNQTNTGTSHKFYLGRFAGNDFTDNGISSIFAASNVPMSWIGSGTTSTSVGTYPVMANGTYVLIGAYQQGSVQHQLYRNGALNAQNTSLTISPTTASQVWSIMSIGADGNDLRTNEAIIWDSYQSSNRTGIESNINTYYGIY
jgi:hypothetical protein